MHVNVICYQIKKKFPSVLLVWNLCYNKLIIFYSIHEILIKAFSFSILYMFRLLSKISLLNISNYLKCCIVDNIFA